MGKKLRVLVLQTGIDLDHTNEVASELRDRNPGWKVDICQARTFYTTDNYRDGLKNYDLVIMGSQYAQDRLTQAMVGDFQ